MTAGEFVALSPLAAISTEMDSGDTRNTRNTRAIDHYTA